MTLKKVPSRRWLAIAALLVGFKASALSQYTTSGSKALAQTAAGVGGSSGTFGVGSAAMVPDLFTGTLIHVLPLPVVPGRNGLQPDVQLRYGSANGSGSIGVGWELNFGDIERRTKGGLNYGADDYVLRANGAAVDLVNINGGQYRAKFESDFRRIRQLVAQDGRPYWEVTTRDGTRWLYGETAQSRQDDPVSPGRIFKWCLDYVQDTSGNYISYSYSKDLGEIYPAEIDFTGHTPDLLPTNAVTFSWGSRSDVPLQYATAFSSAVQTRWLLDHVDIKAGGQLVRRFQLAYATSAPTGRSLLSSFSRAGKNGTQLDTISFNWSATSGAGFSTRSLTGLYGNWDASADRIRPGDFDQDGYEDLVLGPDGSGNWFVLNGSPTGLVSRNPNPWVSGAMADWAGCSNGCTNHIWTGDFNGDGKSDILLGPNPDTAAWTVMTSSGSGFYAPSTWLTWDNGGWFGHAARIRVLDVDGDGISDILVGPNQGGNWHFLRGTGSSFEVHENYIASGLPNWDGDSTQTRVNLVDVTGDGLPDIVMGPDGAGVWRILINQGASGFSAPVVTPSGYGKWSSDLQSALIRMMDVNGDGKMDVVIGPDDSSGSSRGYFYVMLSRGDGTLDDRGAWFTSSSYSGWSGSGNRIRPVDFNGDGMTDVLIGPDGSGNWYVLQSTGAGFIDKGSVLTGFMGAPWDQPQNQIRIRAFDANGDGRQDIVAGPDGSGNWYEVFGPVYPAAASPDLLAGLQNGYGATTTVLYQPSTRFNNTLLPFAVQVVTSVTTDDGNGVSAGTSYSYSGGYFELRTRDFRGFASETTTGPAWPNGAHVQTTTYFHQGDDVAVGVNNPGTLVGYMKGKPYRIVAGDTASTAYTVTDTTYQDAASPPYFNPAIDVRSSYCLNGTTCGRQTRMSYQFDPSNGNVTRADDYGDLSVSGDEKTTLMSYSPNTSAWIVGLPNSVIIYSGAGASTPDPRNQISEADFFYDAVSDCSTASTNLTPTVGKLTRTIRWLNGGTSPETRAAYDGYGNPTCARDANGNVSQTTYDAGLKTFPVTTTSAGTPNAPAGLVSTQKYYGVAGVPWSTSSSDPGLYGLVQSATDPNNATTTFFYDVFGRKVKQTEPDNVSTTWSYNLGAVGSQNVRVVGPQGASETYFDGLGRTIKTHQQGSLSGPWVDTQTRYLASSAVSQSTAPYFAAGGTPLWTIFEYDVRGRPLTVTTPDGAIARSCYDDMAGATGYVDPNGHRKREARDTHGKVIRVDEYRGAVNSCTTSTDTPYATTTYNYDLFGRLEQALNAVGSPVAMAYDTLGRKISGSDPDLGNWSYAYDGVGNVTYQQDQNGHGISFRYDALNRLTLKHYCTTASVTACAGEAATPNDVSYTYDDSAVAYSQGRVTKMADNSGWTAYAYDVLGRAISSTQAIDTSATFITQSTFDPSTRRLASVTYPDPAHTQVNYSYGADGNLSQVSESGRIYATLPDYNERAQVRTVQYGNQVTATYTYDPNNGRLSRVLSASGGLALLDLTYGYDAAGNVKIITDGTNANNTQTFNYDELNRLVSAQSTGYQPGTIAPQGLSYTYDPVRVHVLNSTSDGRSFVHDGNGNRTNDGTRTLGWNFDNLPTTITMASGTTTLTYDGKGARVKKLGPNGTVLYSGKLYDCASSSCTRYIYAGQTRLAAVASSGSVTYFHPDQLGSTRVMTTDQQPPAQSEAVFYQPFGQTASDSSASASRYKFTGQEWDAEIGLYNYGARLYDPSLGRFISADSEIPGTNPQALNRYAYAINNPLRYTDPTGHSFLSVIGDIADFYYTYSGSKLFVNNFVREVTHDVMMIAKGNLIYGVVTGDWDGMVRNWAELQVTALAAYATAGTSSMATTSLSGLAKYTAARAAIGFGSSVSNAMINGAPIDRALKQGAGAAAQSALFATASGTWSWATNTDPLSYSKMPNTIGTKATTAAEKAAGPGFLGEGGTLSQLYYVPVIGPFVQAVSGVHDWVGGSYGEPGSINDGSLGGIGGILGTEPINTILMAPAATWTGLAVLDRGPMSFMVGSIVLPHTAWGVNSPWPNGF